MRVQIATKLEQMEARINKQEQIAEKQKRIQLLRLKLENMKTETWKQKQLLMEEKRQVKEKRERVLRRIEEKGEATNNPIITLKANEKQLSIAKSDLADDLIRYTETRHRLDFILQKFVSRLRYLYPISTTSSNLYCIRNIELPNSKLFIKKESFGNVDLIAAALNFVAHALDLISRWHNIPLRYTMRIMGSHSSIRDDIRFTQTNEFVILFFLFFFLFSDRLFVVVTVFRCTNETLRPSSLDTACTCSTTISCKSFVLLVSLRTSNSTTPSATSSSSLGLSLMNEKNEKEKKRKKATLI